MGEDDAKPAARSKGPIKPAASSVAANMPVPAMAGAGVKPIKTVAAKPAAKAKLPAPMMPEAPVVHSTEPEAVVPTSLIPEAAVPAVAAAPAPEPVAAVSEPVAPLDPLVSPQPQAPELSSAAISHKESIMEATIQDTTTKPQTLFADANERAKAAFEKSTKLIEEMNAFGKGNIEAVVESSKIAAKGFESFGQEAAEYTRKQFEGATAMMKSFASVKSPTELFKLQSDYFRQSFDSLVAESSKHTEAMLKLAGEVAQPLSNRVALAAEKAKIAA